MNTFKDYIRYRLKSSLLRTVVFAVMALILTYNSVSYSLSLFQSPDDGMYYQGFGYIGGEMMYKGYLDLSVSATVLLIVAAVIAVLEMADFKNKRNLDTIYSLPLSRAELALAHYISGAVQVAQTM